MSRRKAYEQAVKLRLEELEKEIDVLREKVKGAEKELIVEHHSSLEKLHDLKEKVKAKVSDLAEAGDDAWEDLQHGIEHYWKSVGNELKSFEDMD